MRAALIISEAGLDIDGFIIFVFRANHNPVPRGAAIVRGDESRGENSPSPLTHRGDARARLDPPAFRAFDKRAPTGYK